MGSHKTFHLNNAVLPLFYKSKKLKKIIKYKNYNNNNNHDNVCGALITTKVIARVHLVHLMNVD